jgi:hypothetical protein
MTPPPEAGSPRRGCITINSRVGSQPVTIHLLKHTKNRIITGAQDEAATRGGRVAQTRLQQVSKQSNKQATSQPGSERTKQLGWSSGPGHHQRWQGHQDAAATKDKKSGSRQDEQTAVTSNLSHTRGMQEQQEMWCTPSWQDDTSCGRNQMWQAHPG